MNKTALLLILMSITSCDKPAACTTGKDHEWGKWKQTDRVGLSGQPNLTRECKACGWQQEKLTDRP